MTKGVVMDSLRVPKGPSLSLRLKAHSFFGLAPCSKMSRLVIARVFSEAIFFIMPDSIKVIVMDKLYSVYIMTNKNNTVLYTGVTNNLKRRVYGHREKRVEVSMTVYEIASEKALAMTSNCQLSDGATWYFFYPMNFSKN